ncbi:MAG: radical SAM protein [Candidatus Kapabacteria bacterium]|nr:radical SAM protein [Candidatus Kapabacteria bacterium]
MRKLLYTLASNTITRMIGTPPYLILFVSDKCTNKCSHCWYNSDWKDENLKGEILSLDELVKLSKSLHNIRFLTISGGEAFLRDDIEEIVRAFVVNSKVSRFDIPTSGFDSELITKKVINILSQNPNTPFRVDVSLDGTEELHNNIRHNRHAFSNALKTIESLGKIKKENKLFDLSIITTISDENNHQITEIAELVKQILPTGEWMVNIIRGNSPGLKISLATTSAYKQANEIIAERFSKNDFTGDRGHSLGKWLTAKNALRRDMILRTIDSTRRGGGCAAGCLTAVVLSNGDVRACEMLPTSFGNLRDHEFDLPKMLASNKGDEIRKEIQDTECICTHECNLSVSILMQPSCWHKLIKNRFLTT